MTEALVPSLREYTARYGLTARRVDALRDDALVMHPGPDEPRRRDQRRGRRPAPLGDRRPGAQRRRRAHGRPVPPARPGGRQGPRQPTTLDSVAASCRRRCAADGARSCSRAAGSIDARASGTADVVVGDDGRIAAVGADLTADRTLDAGGLRRRPGLVDLHTHLRQPGQEEAETIETGARAAALGGYTRVVAMPNTDPAIDRAGVVREVLELGRTAPCDVRTVGRHHRRPGGRAARAAGRDGRARRAALHRRRHRRAGRPAHAPGPGVRRRPAAGVVLAQHCEDPVLSAGGHMHEGEWSSRLGIPGQPAEAEELMVMRDIALARLTGTPRPLPAPVDRRLGRDGAGGQGRRACRSPPRPPPTTSRSPTPSARPTTRCSR